MPLISDEYRELNRQLHADNPLYGNDSFGWSRYARELVVGNGYKTVLDYGCGKGRLARDLLEHEGIVAQEYDPAVEGKDADPSPAELVVCTDVLEHIEPVHLNAVLRHLKELAQKRLFLTIFTGPSGKMLADGRNAHLIVKDGLWWRKKLIEHFQILVWEETGPVVACELVPKKHTGMIKPKARRPMPTEMLAFLTDIKQKINNASDAFSQIDSIKLFEGLDDEPSDLIGVCDILEHLDDIEAALAQIALLARKCAFFAVKISDRHTEWDWRKVLTKRFRIAQWEQTPTGHLLGIGSMTVVVQGVTAMGAVHTDERWENVKRALALVKERISPAPAHERTAILACYGPSLTDTIETLKQASLDPNVDVVSVSGAHDFLLEHGIVPKYHVECDPRPHKADNIAAGVRGVQYLLASVAHPVLFDKLHGHDIRLWHISCEEHIMKLLDEGENSKYLISGGGSVGLRSIPLLYTMGYRDLHIFGMDCSFRQEEGQEVKQWAGKHAGKRQDVVPVMCDGEMFSSSPVLLTYATGFMETVSKVTDLNVRLYGYGLLQAMCAYYMRDGHEPTRRSIEMAGEATSMLAAE